MVACAALAALATAAEKKAEAGEEGVGSFPAAKVLVAGALADVVEGLAQAVATRTEAGLALVVA